jgi:hypothetical protein
VTVARDGVLGLRQLALFKRFNESAQGRRFAFGNPHQNQFQRTAGWFEGSKDNPMWRPLRQGTWIRADSQTGHDESDQRWKIRGNVVYLGGAAILATHVQKHLPGMRIKLWGNQQDRCTGQKTARDILSLCPQMIRRDRLLGSRSGNYDEHIHRWHA